MSVNDTWSTFEQLLKQLINQHIPSKFLSGNKVDKPWISKEIKAHQRRRNKLFNRQKETGRPKNRHRYRQAKATTKRLERQAYWHYVEDLIEVGDPDQT
ncbi:hypothetical protein DPMN_039006 [Dreissena polymorpha]|uniref:Uncharacterized protein n=1 Tax=Dreissena polymorpha TaxID=45954 RepID=A0A9D4RR88_DREPO|nr:hypothetical protein DPMN_039006 [Dreissena polymorpha]